MKLMKQRRGDSAEMAFIEFVDRYNAYIYDCIHATWRLLSDYNDREGELRKPRPPQKTLEDIVREELKKLSLNDEKPLDTK